MTDPILEFLRADKLRTQGEFLIVNRNHPGDIYSKERKENHWIARCFADKKYDAPNGKYYIDSLTAQTQKSAAENEIKNNATFFVTSTRVAGPIKTFIRDYAKAVKALKGVSRVVLPFYSKEVSYEEWKAANEFIDGVITTADTHRELLDAVKEGV